MLDGIARRQIDRPLNALGALLARAGVSANATTIAGFGFGMLACAAIACSWYLAGLALIALNRLADGLDGAIARHSRATDLGGFLDIILDMIFYSGVPFAFALSRPEFALPAAFLIYSFVGTGGSFLAFAVIAAKRDLQTEYHGRKSFYYSAGLMEGTETIIFFVLFCLLPDHFAWLAWLFGGLCWLTTAIRILTGAAIFREKAQERAS